jgi:hypothetical protein
MAEREGIADLGAGSNLGKETGCSMVSVVPLAKGSSRGSSAGVGGRELSMVEVELIESLGIRGGVDLTGLGRSLRPRLLPSPLGRPEIASAAVPEPL